MSDVKQRKQSRRWEKPSLPWRQLAGGHLSCLHCWRRPPLSSGTRCRHERLLLDTRRSFSVQRELSVHYSILSTTFLPDPAYSVRCCCVLLTCSIHSGADACHVCTPVEQQRTAFSPSSVSCCCLSCHCCRALWLWSAVAVPCSLPLCMQTTFKKVRMGVMEYIYRSIFGMIDSGRKCIRLARQIELSPNPLD